MNGFAIQVQNYRSYVEVEAVCGKRRELNSKP